MDLLHPSWFTPPPHPSPPLLVQASNNSFFAEWDPFYDPESSPVTTRACLGTAPGLCDVQSAAIADASRIVWRDLPPFNASALWLRLTACNRASLCTSWSPAAPLLIDWEAPELNVTIAGPVQCPGAAYPCPTVWLDRTDGLTALVSVSDTVATVDHCVWGIGGEAGADNVQGWTQLMDVEEQRHFTATLTSAQPLPEGLPLYVTVRCHDRVARATERVVAFAVLSTAPGAEEAVIRLSRAVAPSPLPETQVTWTGFDVFALALVEYFLAVGLRPGHSNVLPWTGVGNRTDHALMGLRLPAGPVWVTVKAQYPSLRASTSSHRLMVDSTPPIPGTVQRLTLPPLTPQCLGNMSAMELQWFGFEDATSFIALYEFAVGPAGGSTTPEWQAVGRRTYASVEPRQREPGEYQVRVRATDAAGNQAESALDLVVDGSEPQMPVCLSVRARM